MGDRIVRQRHFDQVLLRGFDCLTDGLRNFFRLSIPVSDVAAFVADHNQRAEAEIFTAFHDFSDAVDRHDGVFQLQLRWIDSLRS